VLGGCEVFSSDVCEDPCWVLMPIAGGDVRSGDEDGSWPVPRHGSQVFTDVGQHPGQFWQHDRVSVRSDDGNGLQPLGCLRSRR
jgi:hypothetical protein